MIIPIDNIFNLITSDYIFCGNPKYDSCPFPLVIFQNCDMPFSGKSVFVGNHIC